MERLVPVSYTHLTKKEDQWTWDEFVENMKKLTKVEDGKTVQYGTSNFEEKFSLYTTLELLGSNGAKWFNDDYTQAVGIDSEATRDTLTKIKELRTVYGVAPNPTAVGVDTSHSPTQMFMTGQVASIFVGSYAPVSYTHLNGMWMNASWMWGYLPTYCSPLLKTPWSMAWNP